MVDQNFGGVLLESLRSRPTDFSNLVLLSATRQSGVISTSTTNPTTTKAVGRGGPRQPMANYFYGRQRILRLGHYDLYGVEGLLTYAIESLPLSQMRIGEIEKVSTANLLIILK